MDNDTHPLLQVNDGDWVVITKGSDSALYPLGTITRVREVGLGGRNVRFSDRSWYIVDICARLLTWAELHQLPVGTHYKSVVPGAGLDEVRVTDRRRNGTSTPYADHLRRWAVVKLGSTELEKARDEVGQAQQILAKAQARLAELS